MSMLERVRAQESTRLEQDTARATREHERAVLDRLRSDLIERLGLSVVSALAGSQDETGARRELSVALESLLNTRAYGDVPAQDHGRLTREVLDGILGLGPLQPLLDDATVTEVMVNGVQSLFYECGGALHPAQRVFDSPDQIMMVVDRILAPLGRRLDESSPIVNARLANGYRVNAVLAGVGIALLVLSSVFGALTLVLHEEGPLPLVVPGVFFATAMLCLGAYLSALVLSEKILAVNL